MVYDYKSVSYLGLCFQQLLLSSGSSGLKDDKLLTFAETEYAAYLTTLEKEAETAQKNYERDMRVLEKREKVAEAERSAVTESAGSGGGAFLTPCPIIQIYTL